MTITEDHHERHDHADAQEELFAAPARTHVPGQRTRAHAHTHTTAGAGGAAVNDIDLVAEVIALAVHPGYVLVSDHEHEQVWCRRADRDDAVDPAAVHEAAVVRQLLEQGLLSRGGAVLTSHARRDIQARAVVVPTRTRRWAATRTEQRR
jgi:hypothetical protein